MSEPAMKIDDLGPGEIPREFAVETYWDFAAHPFAHEKLFRSDGARTVVELVGAIGAYAKAWLAEQTTEAESSGLREISPEALSETRIAGSVRVLAEDGVVFRPEWLLGPADEAGVGTVIVRRAAQVLATQIDVSSGDLSIGPETVLEPGAGISGPSIIGARNLLRQGAYLRGDCIIGDDGTFRGELKNVVMMDKANFPHPSYVGDSICGYMTHFGNQATAANLGIFAGMVPKDQRENIVLKIGDRAFDIGRSKIGIIMGDYCQVGCNTVTDPGTFLAPRTIVYALCRVSRGFFGPNQILKNKPLEKGVIEVAPFRSDD